MTTSVKLTTAILLIAGPVALAAKADPPASRPPDDAGVPVVVIRGSQTQVQGVPEKATGQRSQAAPPTGQREAGVIVLRPAPDSFMRETTRLAAEAEAREERAAQEDARERDRQLTKTLQAVEDAARATEEEARTRSERYYPIYVPRPHPPKARPPLDGSLNP
jgi:hypothetical protein